MNQISEFSSGWHGRLDLAFDTQDGKTQVGHCNAKAPLKFQRPFYPEGPAVCHGVMLHTAGGIVGGDRLSTDIRLSESSHGLLTTAAATKIYRSAGANAVQTTTLTLADHARLEWFPQESIVFNGAKYHQNTTVHLSPGATWMGWEMVRLGRSARGEQFEQGEWRSHTEIWRADHPLWIDRQRIQGGDSMLQRQHGLANCPVVGSFAFVGNVVDIDVLNQIRAQWLTQLPSISKQTHRTKIGATRLCEGIVCRYRGTSTVEARKLFMIAWDALRQSALSLAPHRPRIWPV